MKIKFNSNRIEDFIVSQEKTDYGYNNKYKAFNSILVRMELAGKIHHHSEKIDPIFIDKMLDSFKIFKPKCVYVDDSRFRPEHYDEFAFVVRNEANKDMVVCIYTCTFNEKNFILELEVDTYIIKFNQEREICRLSRKALRYINKANDKKLSKLWQSIYNTWY